MLELCGYMPTDNRRSIQLYGCLLYHTDDERYRRPMYHLCMYIYVEHTTYTYAYEWWLKLPDFQIREISFQAIHRNSSRAIGGTGREVKLEFDESLVKSEIQKHMAHTYTYMPIDVWNTIHKKTCISSPTHQLGECWKIWLKICWVG